MPSSVGLGSSVAGNDLSPKVTVAFREVGTKTVVATYLAPA